MQRRWKGQTVPAALTQSGFVSVQKTRRVGRESVWGRQTGKEEGQETVTFSSSCTGWYKRMKAEKVKLGLCYISIDLKHTPT